MYTPPREQPVQHFCDYDWKQSNWTSRSNLELIEICQRREIPGADTGATMIKWLETGHLEYEDLYVSSLEALCRGAWAGSLWLEFAEKLREHDAAQIPDLAPLLAQ